MSALLIDGRFVAVFPRLVKALGGDITAAAVLQAIHYRLQGNGPSIELPLAEIADEIGISPDQTRRATKRLREVGLLLTVDELGRVKRWSVDYDAVAMLDGRTPAISPDLPEPRRNRRSTPAESPHNPGEIAGLTFLIEEIEDKEVSALSARPNAGQLMGAFIDSLPQRPPNRVVSQLAREVRLLLDEGFDPDVIAEGLTSIHRKGLHPSTLASEVNVIVNGGGRKQSGTEMYLRAARTFAEEKHPALLALDAAKEA